MTVLEFLMASRRSSGKGGGASESMNLLFAPALAMTLWNPFLAGGLRCSAQANEGLCTLTHEWQDFVGRRLEQDFALMRRLSHCRAPDEVVTAYSEFWRKAAEDYAKEMSTMTKLMTSVTTKLTHAAQSATDEASKNVVSTLKAA